MKRSKTQLKEALLALGLSEDDVEAFLTKVRDVNTRSKDMVYRKPATSKPVKATVSYRRPAKPKRASYADVAAATLRGIEAKPIGVRFRFPRRKPAAQSAEAFASEVLARMEQINTGAPKKPKIPVVDVGALAALAAILEADMEAETDPRDRRLLQHKLRATRRGHPDYESMASEVLARIGKGKPIQAHGGSGSLSK